MLVEGGTERFDVASFGLDDVGVCSEALRASGKEAGSMEDAAQEIAEYLRDVLGDGESGEPACPLVRVYKTHPYGALEPELQAFARGLLEHEPAEHVRCLTLLGTAGELPAWCSRHASVGHKAIPLPSEEMVSRLPMVAQLVRQLGLDLADVIDPSRLGPEAATRPYEVFHVEEAGGSPDIPAQDEFVRPYGIRSAVGFGGVLFTGDLYAVVLFSRVPITPLVASRLKILALAVRIPLLRFASGRVFSQR